MGCIADLRFSFLRQIQTFQRLAKRPSILFQHRIDDLCYADHDVEPRAHKIIPNLDIITKYQGSILQPFLWFGHAVPHFEAGRPVR